jgi:hypothetical protein
MIKNATGTREYIRSFLKGDAARLGNAAEGIYWFVGRVEKS